MDVHLRSAFHSLLGRVWIGASRVRPLSPELHTSDYSFACPGSSTWVDKVPSRDTPSLNLAGHRRRLRRPEIVQDTAQLLRLVIGLVRHAGEDHLLTVVVAGPGDDDLEGPYLMGGHCSDMTGVDGERDRAGRQRWRGSGRCRRLTFKPRADPQGSLP